MGTATIDPPLKWHGGKAYLAQRIVAMMPPRCRKPNAPEPDDSGWLHYVEPFFGGGSVMLAMDPEGISEVANDMNARLANFWCVLQNKPLFDALNRIMQTTPFSETEFVSAGYFGEEPDIAYDVATGLDDPRAAQAVADASAFLILCRQSLAGRMDSFAPLSRSRTRRGMNEQASAWLNAVAGLPAVHERLKRVVILNRPAVDVIKQQDGPRTLFYCDPPYLHETRSTTGEYEHEMTADQHVYLLDTLAAIKGRFLLSGYRSGLYDSMARANDWHRTDFELPNNAAGGEKKRRMVECVWTNFEPR